MADPAIAPDPICHLNAARAKLGTAPGNNTDPTSSWHDLSENAHHGTLTNFAYEAGNRPRTNSETDKAIWHDLSGNGNDGTLTGFTSWDGVTDGWATGPDRLVLDGTDDRVELPSYTIGTQDMTLEAWASISHLVASNYGALINIGNPNGTHSVSILVSLSGASYVARSYYLSPSAGAGKSILAAESGDQQHLLATFDRDGNMQLFAGNVSRGTSAISAGAADSHPAAVPYLGHYSGWWCECAFASARLYNRVLSESERAQNYAAGPTGTGYVRDGLVLDLNAARAVRPSGWVEL